MYNVNIATINCNSLISNSKRLHLQDYLQRYKSQIVLLQETRLNSRHRPIISGYDLIYVPVGNDKRGTAIAISKKVHYEIVDIELSGVEATFVNIKINNENVLIGSLYIRPKTSTSSCETALGELVNKTAKWDTVILGGDLNAKINPENGIGKAVKRFTNNNPVFNLHSPATATHRLGSILDHFLIKNNAATLSTPYCSVLDRFSDHNGVKLCFGGISIQNLLPRANKYTISFNRVNWAEVNKTVDLAASSADNWTLSSEKEVDKAVEILSTAVNKAIDIHMTKLSDNTQDKFRDLPDDAIVLQKLKNKCKRALKRMEERVRTRIDAYLMVKERLERIDYELQKILKKHFSNILNMRLKNIRPGPFMFKEINKIAGRKVGYQIRSIKDENGKSIVTNKGISEVFKQHFEQISKQRPQPNLLTNNNRIDNCEEWNITVSKLGEIIKNLNNKKSSGPDRISNFIIKNQSFTFLVRLNSVINACLALRYFPKEWKMARVIPLPKKGDANDRNNYRPISLVNCMGKILEKVILTKLKEEMTEKNLLPEYQSGFRSKHTCVDAASALRDIIIHSRSRNENVAVCFIDIRKAFDSVWVQGLVWKLNNFGIDPGICKIIESFLSDRTAFVEVADARSEEYKPERGVPQGTVLGPHLYNLFVSDQPELPNGKYILQYADDTAVISASRSVDKAVKELETSVNSLNDFYKNWGIEINGAKSEMMLFRHKKAVGGRSSIQEIEIDDEPVQEMDAAKYLGIIFQKDLKPDLAIEGRLATARGAAASLNRLLSSKLLNLKVKKLLYTTLIRPVVTYGSPLWAHASRKSINKLEVFERKQLRKITQLFYDKVKKKTPSNKKVYKKAGVVRINQFVSDLNKAFVERYTTHQNVFLREWACTDSTWNKKGDKFTRDLKYNEGKKKK